MNEPARSRSTLNGTQMEARQSDIVTFIVNHRVRNERAEAFETLNRTLNKIVESAPGYLGINVIRTRTETHIEYTVIIRFDSYDHLKAWGESPRRLEYVERLRELSDNTEERLESGLEYWFTVDRPNVKPPPKYKMAAVTMLVIYPLVIVVPKLVSWVVDPIGLPFVIDVLISVLLITGLMTYFAMPAITRVFSGWLYE